MGARTPRIGVVMFTIAAVGCGAREDSTVAPLPAFATELPATTAALVIDRAGDGVTDDSGRSVIDAFLSRIVGSVDDASGAGSATAWRAVEPGVWACEVEAATGYANLAASRNFVSAWSDLQRLPESPGDVQAFADLQLVVDGPALAEMTAAVPAVFRNMLEALGLRGFRYAVTRLSLDEASGTFAARGEIVHTGVQAGLPAILGEPVPLATYAADDGAVATVCANVDVEVARGMLSAVQDGEGFMGSLTGAALSGVLKAVADQILANWTGAVAIQVFGEDAEPGDRARLAIGLRDGEGLEDGLDRLLAERAEGGWELPGGVTARVVGGWLHVGRGADAAAADSPLVDVGAPVSLRIDAGAAEFTGDVAIRAGAERWSFTVDGRRR